MNDLDRDLESRLKNWYAGFTPEDSARAVAGVAAVVESARSRRVATGRPRWMRPALALGAVAILVAALVAVPLWLRPQVVPISSASASATATPGATPRPSDTFTPRPSSVLGPGASVDDAGPIRGGGIWAVSKTTLLVSLDGGVDWTFGSIPDAPDGVDFMPSTTAVDAMHAWTVRAGPGSHTGGTNDFISLVAYRTVDGGRTWQSTTIPGNFSGYNFKLMFADAGHGVLAATAWRTDGKTTFYRTSDGGATWAAGATAAVEPELSISDATTLWAASFGGGAMCAMCGEAPLQVSRDAGRTWAVATIAGYEGKLTTSSFGSAGAPVFLDPSTGYLVLHDSPSEATSDGSSKVFRTTDGGRTWSLVARVPYWLDGVSIADDTHWFGLVPSGEVVTSDAGKTWRLVVNDLAQSTNWGSWLVDPIHGGALLGVSSSASGDRVLYLTADGGVSWHPADFGSAAPVASP